VLLLTASLPVFLIADARLIRGHQTRLQYELQYSFLSACGGSALAGLNFLPLFHLGLFAQELVLLVGCWRLARRLFSSPYAAFFVSVAALGSAFGLSHSGSNLQSLCALPLILSLLHDALDEGSRRTLFLAGLLAALAGPAAPIAALLYFVGRAFVRGEPLRDLLKNLRWKKSDPLLILGLVASWLAVFIAGGLRTAADSSRPEGRDLFVYAGLANPLRYLDFLAGATPSLDWSVYCGALTLAFAIVALMTTPRAQALKLIAALPAGLLILGAALFLFFSLVPSGRPDPTAPFGTPLLRLFVVFLAGAGFQRMLTDARPEALLAGGRWLLIGCLLLSLASWSAAMRPDRFRESLTMLVAGEPAGSTASAVLQPRPFPDRGGSSLPSDLLGASALTAGLAGALLILWGSRSRVGPLALTLILFLHPLDVFSWKFRMSWLETFAANPAQRELQRLEPRPLPAPRVMSLKAAPRYKAFHRIAPGRSNPQYVPRKDPSEIVAAYWGVELMRPDAGAPDPRSFGPGRKLCILLAGLNALFWLLWTLRSALLLALRGGSSP